ncbi:MAG TPA: 2TM domain-containing protein [Acidimicrobiales bacterium]
MPTPTLEAYKRAEVTAAKEESRRGFTVHLVITLIVWAILIAVNVFVASEFPWSIFPVVGMTIGLLAHWYFGVVHVDASVQKHQRDIERRAA